MLTTQKFHPNILNLLASKFSYLDMELSISHGFIGQKARLRFGGLITTKLSIIVIGIFSAQLLKIV
ncbi:hypothetical protein L63ED372_02902 [Limnohabitans sp. 63ED37-2]|nr:hypothetical protein L63ED372_02902 [Limnohabitans sp. 63ED37-2]